MNKNACRTIGQTAIARFALLTLVSNLLLLALPTVVQAQFNYTTNDGTITITGYTGPGGAVTIPSAINGLPVTSIGDSSFSGQSSLTGVTIPKSVTNIEYYAFMELRRLTSVVIPDSVINIGGLAFDSCGLTNVSIGNSVTCIGYGAFSNCRNLTTVTIPDSVLNLGGLAFSTCLSLTNVSIGNGVTSIGDGAFSYCHSLTGAYFRGNAPEIGSDLFFGDIESTAIVYYLPGTAGWTNSFGGLPTARWTFPKPMILTFPPYFGVQTNQFGFRVSWATNRTTVVEACIDLAAPVWTPLATNALAPTGWFQFTDPEWTNYPSRIYRIRSQ